MIICTETVHWDGVKAQLVIDYFILFSTQQFSSLNVIYAINNLDIKRWSVSEIYHPYEATPRSLHISKTKPRDDDFFVHWRIV